MKYAHYESLHAYMICIGAHGHDASSLIPRSLTVDAQRQRHTSKNLGTRGVAPPTMPWATQAPRNRLLEMLQVTWQMDKPRIEGRGPPALSLNTARASREAWVHYRDPPCKMSTDSNPIS